MKSLQTVLGQEVEVLIICYEHDILNCGCVK